MKLFMVLLGCRLKGRNTEQHDIFFGIASEIKELIPSFETFWPEAKGKMHIDAWREITTVNGFDVKIIERHKYQNIKESKEKLFFLNLGGYKPNEFDEFHYKMISVKTNLAEAIKEAKQNSFYKHFGFKGAESHVDDKYGIDVDDACEIKDILSFDLKNKYAIQIEQSSDLSHQDTLHIGYFKFDKL